MNSVPKFTLVTALLGITSLLVAGLLSWYIVETNNEDAQRSCNRVVASRNDSRAMWIYLLKTKGGENPKASAIFSRKLNELLPALVCDENGNWAPVE